MDTEDANASSKHCKCLPVTTTAGGSLWLVWLLLRGLLEEHALQGSRHVLE